jgi:hypothetical protein
MILYTIPPEASRICDECKGLAQYGFKVKRQKSETALCKPCAEELLVHLRRELKES